jgi:hypothetical protein
MAKFVVQRPSATLDKRCDSRSPAADPSSSKMLVCPRKAPHMIASSVTAA